MDESTAYLNGEFLPASRVNIAPDDLGFVMGVSVSERLRTFRGRLFQAECHIERLAKSLATVDLDIDLTSTELRDVLDRLVVENTDHREPNDDLGIALFVTPGAAGAARPTFGITAYPLPFGQWADHYDHGQSLVETGIRQVPENCWPPDLKCRSRMHYYLADRLAVRQSPGARAILLDQDGYVSEASTANIVLYDAGRGIVSPPLDRILPGVSLSVLTRLAQGIGIDVQHEPFCLNDLATADEVLLCSTSPCVWPVTSLNGQPIGAGEAGSVFHRLLAAWSDLVGLDIAAQARRFAGRC